jgi:putative DNA primase/helicase
VGKADVLLDDAGAKAVGSDDPEDDFLRGLLSGGPVPVTKIDAEGKEAGFSRADLRRARTRMNIQTKKLGMKDGWAWSLPNAAPSRVGEGVEGVPISGSMFSATFGDEDAFDPLLDGT